MIYLIETILHLNYSTCDGNEKHSKNLDDKNINIRTQRPQIDSVFGLFYFSGSVLPFFFPPLHSMQSKHFANITTFECSIVTGKRSLCICPPETKQSVQNKWKHSTGYGTTYITDARQMRWRRWRQQQQQPTKTTHVRTSHSQWHSHLCKWIAFHDIIITNELLNDLFIHINVDRILFDSCTFYRRSILSTKQYEIRIKLCVIKLPIVIILCVTIRRIRNSGFQFNSFGKCLSFQSIDHGNGLVRPIGHRSHSFSRLNQKIIIETIWRGNWLSKSGHWIDMLPVTKSSPKHINTHDVWCASLSMLWPIGHLDWSIAGGN